MSRRHWVGIVVFALLAVSLIVALLAPHLERYTEQVDLGPTAQAKLNTFLAAELFLHKQGIDLTRLASVKAFEQLPSESKTVIWLSSRQEMTPRQVERVMQWVAAGGHLIIAAQGRFDQPTGKNGDPILDLLGIEKWNTQAFIEQADTEDVSPATPHPELTELWLENEDAPAYLKFDPDWHLHDGHNRAHAWANSGQATHLLQLAHDDGVITVLSDAQLWHNDNLALFDHAWLLWYLTQDSTVSLIQRAPREGLGKVLSEHFATALVMLVLLAIALIWHAAPRVGPVQEAPPPARRRLTEYLHASASFRWRQGQAAQLLQSLQRDIQQRACMHHPGFDRLGVTDQWQILARLSALPPSDISQAMRPAPDKTSNAQAFIRKVQQLQALRNRL